MSPFDGPPIPRRFNIVWPWHKGPAPGAFSIKVYDSAGNLIGQLGSGETKLAALDLREGDSYTVVIVTKNTSTKAGVPWPARLTLNVTATAGSTQLIPPNPSAADYAAGAEKTSSFTMPVPLGLGGATGQLAVTFTDPNGVSLGSGSLAISVATLPVVYGATVDIGLPASMVEGQTYSIPVTVTNSSTKGGTPWPATLSLAAMVTTPAGTLLSTNPASYSYAAAEGHSQNFSVAVPLGAGGAVLSFAVTVNDPNNAIAATLIKTITITTVPVSYSGTISVGTHSKYDLDGSGTADHNDLVLLEKVIANMWSDPAVVAAVSYWGSQAALLAACDLNGDGKVNAGDITAFTIATGIG
jgi:hypothetical protein